MDMKFHCKINVRHNIHVYFLCISTSCSIYVELFFIEFNFCALGSSQKLSSCRKMVILYFEFIGSSVPSSLLMLFTPFCLYWQEG